MSDESKHRGPHLPHLTRRAFLVSGTLAGAGVFVGCGREAEPVEAAATPAPAPPPAPLPDLPGLGPAPRPVVPRHGVAMGGGKGLDPDTGAKRYWLSSVNLDSGERRTEITTDFFPHGVAIHPQKPHVVMLFEKHGPGCCQVDLKEGTVTAKVSTVDGNSFYGHGAYSRDSKQFFCTETAVSDGYRGLLMVRDSETFEALGEMPTGGKEPHDCVLVNAGRTLVVTNGGGHVDLGGEASVTYVDPSRREVLHTLEFDDDSLNAGHLFLTSKGELAVVSAPRVGLDQADPKVHGAISFFTPGQDRSPRTVKDPILGDMRGETLSVAIHEPSMVVGCTNPDGNLVTFWDFHTGKLLKVHRDLPGPRGIGLTLDQKYFAVTYGPEASLVLLDVKTLEPTAEAKLAHSWMTGSHVVVHDLV